MSETGNQETDELSQITIHNDLESLKRESRAKNESTSKSLAENVKEMLTKLQRNLLVRYTSPDDLMSTSFQFKRSRTLKENYKTLEEKIKFLGASDIQPYYDEEQVPYLRPPKQPSPACKFESCRLGCVCETLNKGPELRVKDHCNQNACIFGCICDKPMTRLRSRDGYSTKVILKKNNPYQKPYYRRSSR